MIQDDVSLIVHRPGLIWGFDFADGEARSLDDADLDSQPWPSRGFRWMHLNLSDQRSLRWLASALPHRMMALLSSVDTHQTFLLEQDMLGMVLQDVEHDFHDGDPRIGALRVIVRPSMVITARRHPVRSADLLKRRIETGARPVGPAEALDLILTCVLEVFRETTAELEAKVQDIEDELLQDRPAPEARQFITLRAVMVRLRRSLVGMRAMLRRLEEAAETPASYAAAADHAIARMAVLDTDLLAVQSQLRLLRDELDLQAAQQTNRTLYVLSVIGALMVPATLVTGIFGMNTGGMLWLNDPHGSIWAMGLVFGSALVTYLILRFSGFMRR
jgi:zinc transporter